LKGGYILKKEKEIITITCPECHQRSTIEVNLISPSLYCGFCPKCITEEGSHVDFFIDTYEMKIVKEEEAQKAKEAFHDNDFNETAH